MSGRGILPEFVGSLRAPAMTSSAPLHATSFALRRRFPPSACLIRDGTADRDGIEHDSRRGGAEGSIGKHAECVVDGRQRRRNATNTVIVKICESLNPASRKACTSAALVWFGSRATIRAQPAMTRSLGLRPSSTPRNTPAAVYASLASASLDPHTSEQYESPKADAHAATRMKR